MESSGLPYGTTQREHAYNFCSPFTGQLALVSRLFQHVASLACVRPPAEHTTGKGSSNGWRTPLNKTKYSEQRDEETGYSYFGARYYDNDLSGLFLSVDPMSDKYPSISPYAYCAWNPVKLVDPDGREIWIKGSDGNEYQYKNGKLYNKDGSEYTGNDDFATRVQKDLNTLKEKGMNKEVTHLEGSKKKHTIELSDNFNSTDPGTEGNKDISNGIGSGTLIKYNPNRTEIEGWERPAVVGLAHET